jgi:hypothetical protein
MNANALRRIGAAILSVSALLALAPGLASAQQSKSAKPLPVPVTGSFTLGGATQALENAVFVIEKFAEQDGKLVAVGELKEAGNPAAAGLPLTLPVKDPPSGSCQVLDLVLGPLHLDLLGLVIDLNQVNLDITAQSGQGNLLGNLLCAVTNLLDGAGAAGANTGAIANLLNNILALL